MILTRQVLQYIYVVMPCIAFKKDIYIYNWGIIGKNLEHCFIA